LFLVHRRRVPPRSVNVTPRRTRSAADAVTVPSTASTRPAHSADILLLSCDHTSGAKRLRGERPPELGACATLRMFRGGSRTDSGRILLRLRRSRRQPRHELLDLHSVSLLLHVPCITLVCQNPTCMLSMSFFVERLAMML